MEVDRLTSTPIVCSSEKVFVSHASYTSSFRSHKEECYCPKPQYLPPVLTTRSTIISILGPEIKSQAIFFNQHHQ